MLLRAVEEKAFFPVGSDREVRSDFQLIAGTNRDLRRDVEQGRFREDLLARIDLWAFRLPGLRDRPEDIAPNLEYELDRWAQASGEAVTFSREARERFLAFAGGRDALWTGNFRDFNAAVRRMSTLASGGRITGEIVDEEIARLREAWRRDGSPPGGGLVDELLGVRAQRRSIRSTGSSSRRCCASAGARGRSRTRGERSSRCRGRRRAPPTTPTGCGSTWRATGWRGRTWRARPAGEGGRLARDDGAPASGRRDGLRGQLSSRGTWLRPRQGLEPGEGPCSPGSIRRSVAAVRFRW